MAVYRGGNLTTDYKNFVRRVLNEGGTYLYPKSTYIEERLKKIEEVNPLFALIPTAGDTGVVYTMMPNTGSMDIEVSRSGSATYFDENGAIQIAQPDKPRFNYDPLTGEFKGILVEPETINRVTHNNPNNLATLGYFIESVSDERFGTIYKIIETLDYTGTHQFNSVTIGSVWLNDLRVRYVIAKSGSGNRYLQVSPRSNGWNGRVFNLETKTSIFAPNINAEDFIIDIGDGWAIYGYVDKVGSAAISTNLNYSISFSPNATNNSVSHQYTGDGESHIFVVPYPMAYVGDKFIMPIITSGSIVTRPADIMTVQPPSGSTQCIYSSDGIEYTVDVPETGSFQIPSGSIEYLYMI